MDRIVRKAELVEEVAERTGLDRVRAGETVEAVLAVIRDELAAGRDVAFAGFGRFHVGERGARRGVNPRTGEPMTIDATRLPRFTAGAALKKAVRS